MRIIIKVYADNEEDMTKVKFEDLKKIVATLQELKIPSLQLRVVGTVEII